MAGNANRIEALLEAALAAFREEYAPPIPEPPRDDLTWPPVPTGPVVYVPAGGDLWAIVAAAKPNTIIELERGATYQGPVILPRTAEPSYITIRTRGEFPRRRILPTDPGLATIVSELPGTPPISCAPGAHHWVLDALAVTQTVGQCWSLMELGHGEASSMEAVPQFLWVHRCRLHVPDDLEQRWCITPNSFDVQIRRNSITGAKEIGQDSQAIGARLGARIAIVDNQIEGAGENILFGGADPHLLNAVPEDIEISDNDITKPLTWMGSSWQIKHLLELKNARRVKITRNRFSNCWPAALDGEAVLFTVRNQDGRAPWAVVEDIEFTHNDLRNVASGIKMHAQDNKYPSQRSSRFTIADNYMEIDRMGKDGRIVQGAPLDDLTIERTIAIANGTSAYYFRSDVPPGQRFMFRDNAYLENTYGFWCETKPLETVFPGAVWERIVIGSDRKPDLVGRNTSQVIPVSEFIARYRKSA